MLSLCSPTLKFAGASNSTTYTRCLKWRSADDLDALLRGEEPRTSGRNSSVGFSHPTDHLYVEDKCSGSLKRRSDGSVRREWGSSGTVAMGPGGKRKALRMDGICNDGQIIESVASGHKDDGPVNFADFAVQHFEEPSGDPLSMLSSELSAIHSKVPAVTNRRRIETSNFRVAGSSGGAGAGKSPEDPQSNPYKRRTVQDHCCFRVGAQPTRSARGEQQKPSAPRFCQKCGSSNVQPEFMATESSSVKTEVWGSRNVDEFTAGGDIGSRVKCLNCFFVG